MNISQLKVFNEVVRQQSFTKAALALGQTQPAVSKTIRLLETEVGEPLLIRANDAVLLTSLGEQVIAHARVVLKEFDALRTLVNEHRGIEQGTLRIGVPPSLAGWPTARLVSAFRRRHPRIVCKIFEGDPSELSEWVSGGVVDVILFTRALGSWEWSPVTHEPFVAIMPRPAQSDDPLTLHDLANLPLITSNCGIDRILEKCFTERGLSFSPHIRTRSYSTIFAMVEEGLGSSILPQSIAAQAGSRVIVRQIVDGPVRALGVLQPKRTSRIAEAFVAEAKALLPAGYARQTGEKAVAQI
jgi:DNA-binding transcriptional LysR family regulator